MNDPRTNHDAAPAATARDADRGRTDKADARPGEGTGDTQEPAARMIGRLLDERERLMVKQTVMDPDDDYIRERDTVF